MLRTVEPVKAPAYLRVATRRWYAKVLLDFVLEEHHVRLLTLACEAWDRGLEAREALKKGGLTYFDRFGTPKARPEVAIERDARMAYIRILREMNLDVATPEDTPRPPPRSRYGRPMH